MVKAQDGKGKEAGGIPALFKRKHVSSKFIYVKKSKYYLLMMRLYLCRIQTHILSVIRVVIQCGTAL